MWNILYILDMLRKSCFNYPETLTAVGGGAGAIYWCGFLALEIFKKRRDSIYFLYKRFSYTLILVVELENIMLIRSAIDSKRLYKKYQPCVLRSIGSILPRPTGEGKVRG